MTLNSARFVAANARSAVVYFGSEGGGVTYRLSDGSVWKLSRYEARKVGQPRWAHLPDGQVEPGQPGQPGRALERIE